MIKFFSAILIFFSLTSVALAQARLEVEFDPDPLFSADNFNPGDQVSGQVTVTNNSESVQTVIAAAANVDDPAGLARVINFQIVSSAGSIIFNGDLADFFNQGELVLAPLGASGSQVFNFTARFKLTDNNDLQAETLSFDLCVGFRGDESGLNCGNSTIINEDPTGDSQNNNFNQGDAETTGARTLSGGNTRLLIIGEQLAEITPASSALITWQTNIPATSQVVYGLSVASPYTLDLAAPNFGYPQTTAEDLQKVTKHAVMLANLVPGATYNYRVVSRASPPTVSFERYFSIPPISSPLALSDSPVSPSMPSGSVRQSRGGGSEVVEAATELGLNQEATEFEPIGKKYPKLELPASIFDGNNLAAAGFALTDIPSSAWLVLLALLTFIVSVLAFKRSRRGL